MRRTLVPAWIWILMGCSGGGGLSNSSAGSTSGSGATGTTGTGGGGATGTVGSTGVSATGSGAAGGGAVGSGGAGGGGAVGSGGADGGAVGSGGATGSGAAGGMTTVPPDGPLGDRLTTTDVTVPEGAKEGVRNWRIWDYVPLGVAPVFTLPLANCGTLVGFSSESGSGVGARVVLLGASDELVDDYDLGAGFELRGLAAEPDGHFGALLWDGDAETIFVKRYDLAGTEQFSTELQNDDNHPTDFGIGESRLEYGGGRYGAYYHVHSDSGHEGDTLKWVDAASGGESTEWSWGCSHSMSNLLRFHPAGMDFLAACVTDCYPGTDGSDFETQSLGGIYLNYDDDKVLDVDAGCNGYVAGELGGLALAPVGYKLVFNAHQTPATLGQSSYDPDSMNQDIGFSSIGADLSAGGVVWLTDTPDIDEADSSIARWEPSDGDAEQYVVGWLEPEGVYRLARVDPTGAVLEGPVDVADRARWGRRDDPFRQHFNKDVVWAWFDEAGSTTLHVARLRSGAAYECAAF